MFNILLFVYFVACFEFHLQLFFVKMEIVSEFHLQAGYR